MQFTMLHEEPYDDWAEARVQIGMADWHDDGETDLAVRYVYPDRNGNLTQHITLPIGVVNQGHEMMAAVRIRTAGDLRDAIIAGDVTMVDGATRRQAQERDQ